VTRFCGHFNTSEGQVQVAIMVGLDSDNRDNRDISDVSDDDEGNNNPNAIVQGSGSNVRQGEATDPNNPNPPPFTPPFTPPSFTELYHLVPILGDVIAPRVEQNMRAIWQLWYAFCQRQNRPVHEPLGTGYGLGLYTNWQPHSQFNKYDSATVANFFVYLGERLVLPHVVDRAKIFLNAHVKGESYCRQRLDGEDDPVYPDPQVGNLRTVQTVCRNLQRHVATAAEANHEDIQVDEHMTITPVQVRRLLDDLFMLNNPSHPLYRHKPLAILNFLASFFSSMQVCRRGEINYEQKITQRYVEEVEKIGPEGTMCSFIVSRKSKNARGTGKSRVCHAPHSDPLRDSAFHHGLLWLYRFIILGEPLPDLANYALACLVATYRKEVDSIALGRTMYGSIWTRVFDAAARYIDVLKKTHQGKLQGILEMKDAGIATDDVSRFVGQQSKMAAETAALAKHYILNPPVSCVVQRAGGDPTRTRDHCPAYSSVEVPDDLLRQNAVLAALLDQRDRIHTDYETFYKRKDRKSRQLYAAKGTVDSLIHDIKRVFQVLAARPVDPKTFAIHANSTETILQKYKLGTFSDIFGLEMFHTPAFVQFQSRMREREDNYILTTSSTPRPVLNEVERILKDHSDPRFNSVLYAVHQIGQKVDMFGQKFDTLMRQQQGTVPPVSTAEIPPQLQAVTTADTTVVPVILPTMNPREDTVADGGQREIRRGIRERDALLANPNRQIRFCDRDFSVRTERQFRRMLDEYRLVWKPLEVSKGARWRHDEHIVTTTGTEMILNARNMWWSRRKPVFDLFDLFVTRGDDEMAAVEKIVQIYESTPLSPRGHNITLVNVGRHFRGKLAQIAPREHDRGRLSAAYLQQLRGNPGQNPGQMAQQPHVAMAQQHPHVAMVQQHPHVQQPHVRMPQHRHPQAGRAQHPHPAMVAQQPPNLVQTTAWQPNAARTTARQSNSAQTTARQHNAMRTTNASARQPAHADAFAGAFSPVNYLNELARVEEEGEQVRQQQQMSQIHQRQQYERDHQELLMNRRWDLEDHAMSQAARGQSRYGNEAVPMWQQGPFHPVVHVPTQTYTVYPGQQETRGQPENNLELHERLEQEEQMNEEPLRRRR
jgi:hypothetical protein